MLNVKIDQELTAGVEQLARQSGKTKTAIVREAVARYVEDAVDYQDAVSAKKKGGRTFGLAEMKMRHGLES